MNDLRTEFVNDGQGRLRRRLEYTVTGDSVLVWLLATETVHYIYDGMRVIQERNDSNVPTVCDTRGSDLSGTLEGLPRERILRKDPAMKPTTDIADSVANLRSILSRGKGGIGGLLGRSHGYASGNWSTHDAYGSLAGANGYRYSSKEWLATPVYWFSVNVPFAVEV